MGKNIFIGILAAVFIYVAYGNIYAPYAEKQAKHEELIKKAKSKKKKSAKKKKDRRKKAKKDAKVVKKIEKRLPLQGEIPRNPFVTFEYIDQLRAQELAIQKRLESEKMKRVAQKMETSRRKKKRKLKPKLLVSSSTSEGSEKIKFPTFLVTSILVNPDGRNIAVINKKVYTEGESIDKVEISRIRQKSVTLKIGNKTKVFFLREPNIPLKVHTE